MKRFIISDLHFGHANVIKYCNRPFIDAEDMDKKLIENWNSVVSKDDIVYVLGDFTLSRRMDVIKHYVQALNGFKVLVMGNHDTRKPKDYIEAGFTQATRKPIMIEPGVIFMHEPFADDRFIADNYIYFFGHVHDKKCMMDNHSNCFCVCADRINFYPVDFDSLLKNIKKIIQKDKK